ncbi:hypothetical protein HD554DRAFT_1547819 [Boletus coccyginus]|nr:hypothetical protein HD554DRAFT_1547819 [Boletus coccyginus]
MLSLSAPVSILGSCHVNVERRDSPPDVSGFRFLNSPSPDTAYPMPHHPSLLALAMGMRRCGKPPHLHHVVEAFYLCKIERVVYNSDPPRMAVAQQGLNRPSSTLHFSCTSDTYTLLHTCSAYIPESLRSGIVLGPHHGRRFFCQDACYTRDHTLYLITVDFTTHRSQRGADRKVAETSKYRNNRCSSRRMRPGIHEEAPLLLWKHRKHCLGKTSNPCRIVDP